MDNQHHLVFWPFRLDATNEQLWREGREIILRRKTFEVLRYLVEHPGQLVTKTALLEAVWKEVVVSDTLPAVCVGELRKALGDNAKTPQFIETVHGRGYRFIAKLSISAMNLVTQPSSLPSGPAPIVVGRDAELARVRSWYAEMLAARRQVLLVAGEAGIGKTTFVQAFLEPIDKENRTQIGRGQCIAQNGSGEPYMPVLEALTRLAHKSGGARSIDLLKKFAPSWMVQLPALLTAEGRMQLQSELQGVTQQRMLREMAHALEALAAESPLVLVLEDLHWSDFSTLELISAIARRTEPARLMIVGTYRPVEVLATEHPLRTLKGELELHRQCNELRLKLLSEEDVAAYLAKRFADDETWQSLDSVAPVIHARTEGNPLFMVNVVDYLVEQGSLLDPVKIDAPHTIQQMIERNLERLHQGEQRALEAASAAGAEFSAAAVAAALERPLSEMEDCYMKLAQHEQFVGAAGVATWPDGTTASRFHFHHTLYADVFYNRMAASRRVELHRRIAERQEAAYGERASEIAAALAHHYIQSGDSLKAVKYLRLAAEQAMSRSAYVEARNQLGRALELLRTQPACVERDQSEKVVRLDLAICMKFTGDLGTPANGENLERARDLSERTGDEASLCQVLDALGDHFYQGDENQKIQAVGQELLQIANSTHRSEMEGRARFWLGAAARMRGDFMTAVAEYEQACQLPAGEAPVWDPIGWDWRIRTRTLAGYAWWTLGFPTRAQERIAESVAVARSIKAPPSDLILTLLWASGFYILLKDWKMALNHCDEARRIAHELGMMDGSGYSRGLPLARLGQPEAGLAELLPFKKRMGTLPAWRGRFFWNLADIYLVMGRAREGLEAVDQALEFTRGEFDAELRRLKGELMLLGEGCASAEATQWFRAAIEVARRQSAKSWELRATTSLARLLEKRGRGEKARAMLAEIYAWFTEGFGTPDLKEAKALLDELESRPSQSKTRNPNSG